MNKWLALIGLYIAQGLPHGFFGQAMPALMREQGMDLTLIGLLSLVALPWALKFLWAPWLDRVALIAGEHRRSWIIAMNYSAVALLLLLASQPMSYWVDQGLWWMLAALLLVNLSMATQDIATDALAVENISYPQRGLGNAVQVAGYRIGMVIAGGGLVVTLGHWGWQATLLLLALLLAAATLPLWRFQPKPHQVGEHSVWQQWRQLFARGGIVWWLLMVITYKFGDAFGTQMVRPLLVDTGLQLTELGWLMGTYGFSAGLLGAVVGGWSIRYLGRQTALLAFLLLEGLALLSYVGISGQPQLPWTQILLAVGLEHVAGGMATAALFTVMMDYCRPSHEASDYALQSCLVIVAGLLASALSGLSATHLGYDGHFALAAGLCVAALWPVWQLIRQGQIAARTH
ncbi:MFS transporter [Bacterioplanes sanyensis]|uniref:MFS transporter n=1 Tax=Bacterioplanes sanyensis TaxID=1249553 RepID=A0A222FN42_9GAMM|nr:MFS transporter [Bacterioplanes sanyensis]ASP40438.1 MFS transporter [Bacterioplanes sanyensis]